MKATSTDTSPTPQDATPSRVTMAQLRLPVGVLATVVVAVALVYAVGGRDAGLVTQAIVTGLLLGGVYALVSIGLTLIFGVLGIVNFAQGSMLTLSMYLVY